MKTYNNYIIPCALALVALGLFIRYLIGRRWFNRLGFDGRESIARLHRVL